MAIKHQPTNFKDILILLNHEIYIDITMSMLPWYGLVQVVVVEGAVD